jgi:hypothetical protein
MVDRPRVHSPRPMAAVSSLPLVGASSSSSSSGSPDHVSALSGRATRARIRPVIRHGRLEGRPSCPGFPLPFGCRRSLLGHPVPARELGLPHGRLTGPPDGGPDLDGVSTIRTHKTRPGMAPSIAGDGGAHPGQPLEHRSEISVYGISRTSSLADLLGACDLVSHSWIRQCRRRSKLCSVGLRVADGTVADGVGQVMSGVDPELRVGVTKGGLDRLLG